MSNVLGGIAVNIAIDGGISISFATATDMTFKYRVIRNSTGVVVGSNDYQTYNTTYKYLSLFYTPPNVNDTYTLYVTTKYIDYDNCISYDSGVSSSYGNGGTYATCLEYATVEVEDSGFVFDSPKYTLNYSWATTTSNSIVTLATEIGVGARNQSTSSNVDLYKSSSILVSKSGSNVSFNVPDEGTFQIYAATNYGSVTSFFYPPPFSLVSCVIQNTTFNITKPSSPSTNDGSILANFASNGVLYNIELYKGSVNVASFNNVYSKTTGYNFTGLSSGVYNIVIYAVNSPTACRYTSSSLNLQSTVRYYINNSGTYTYYNTCPLPQINVVNTGNKVISVSWLPEGAENGLTTVYEYVVTGLSSTTGSNTTIVTSTGTATSFNFTATLGVTYTIKVRAICKTSDNTDNVSGYSSTTYSISYFYKQSPQGLSYLETCPMVSSTVGVDQNNTLSVNWYSAGEVGKETSYPGRYALTIWDAATNGKNIFSQQYVGSYNASLANVSEDKTYRIELITGCSADVFSPVLTQTITPLYFVAAVTNGVVGAPQPSVILSTRINNANVIQQQAGVPDVVFTMPSTSKTLTLAGGTYTFKASDPLNPLNYKIRTVTVLECFLTKLDVSVVMSNFNGGLSTATFTIDSGAQYTYTLSGDAYKTYSVSNFDKGFAKNDLPAGNYTIRATQANNPSCWIEKTFTVYDCNATIDSVDVVNPTNFGGTGIAKVISNSITPQDYIKEYRVELTSSPTTNPVFSIDPQFNVSSGNWTAYVRYRLDPKAGANTDKKDVFCQVSYQFNVNQPSQCNLPKPVDLKIVNPTLFGGNGNVKSNLSSYNGNSKLYRIRTDAGKIVVDWTNTSEFNLPAGSYLYDVNVSDIVDCANTTAFQITEPLCTLDASKFTTTVTPRSFTSADGTITISPKSTPTGTLYYSLVKNDTGAEISTYTATSAAQGKTFAGLTNATYTINISYVNSACTTAIQLIVGSNASSCNLTSVSMQVATKDVTTSNGSDGSATVNLGSFDTNGLTFECFLKKDGIIITKASSATVFTGLTAGDYEAVIDYKEQPSCTKIVPFTITQPLRCNLSDTNNIRVDTTPATYGMANGSATINVFTSIMSGAIIQYRINTQLSNLSTTSWQTSNVFTNLALGNYYFEIRYPDYPYCVANGIDKVFPVNHLCPTVNLQINAIDNGNDIIFTWTNVTPAPVTYDLIIQKAGTTINTVSVNSNTYTIAGAAKNTFYKIQVTPRYTSCTPVTKESDPYQLVANTSCQIPSAMSASVDPGDNTHTLVSWGAVNNGTYLFSFKKDTDSGYSSEIETANPNYSILLEKGVAYNFQVRTKCAVTVANTTNNSAYTYLNYTRFLCAQPSNIVVTEQAGGILKVTCTVPGNKMYYSYRKTNENYTGNDTYIESNTFSFTPETNTSYEIRIKSVCNNQEDPTSPYVLTAYTRSCPVVQVSSITYSPTADNQSLVMSWLSNETNFKCRYKIKTEADSTYSTWQNVTQRSFTFTPIPNKVYNVQIVTICGAALSSECNVDAILYRCDLVTSLSGGYSVPDN